MAKMPFTPSIQVDMVNVTVTWPTKVALTATFHVDMASVTVTWHLLPALTLPGHKNALIEVNIDDRFSAMPASYSLLLC